MDSEYLKKHVGDALTRGLTEIVQTRPSDPIEYLALWLQKYVSNRDYETKVNKDQIQLEKERKDYLIEQQRQQAMKEEQQLIAKQEAYEKAASLPVVMDTTPRPMPPEVSESLTTLVEGDEEQKNNTTEANSDLEEAKQFASAETGVEIPPENADAEEEPAISDQDDGVEQDGS